MPKKTLHETYTSIRERIALARRLISFGEINPALSKLFLECATVDDTEVKSTLESVVRQRLAMQEFETEFKLYSERLVAAGKDPLREEDAYPCLYDRTTETGYDRHYIYHPAWAARILAQSSPSKHVDISSTLHFCTLISAFIEVDFYDYRPAPLTLSNLTSTAADLTNLPFDTHSIESLSCMHVIEHIGLGRYGDPYDVDGDKKAASELSRVLAHGGKLLVAFPVGRPRIQFNAHRVYSHEQVLNLFSGLKLLQHALIPDGDVADGPIENPSTELIAAQSYGCGCYVFEK
jgi:SAM-dependent methyltransferase